MFTLTEPLFASCNIYWSKTIFIFTFKHISSARCIVVRAKLTYLGVIVYRRVALNFYTRLQAPDRNFVSRVIVKRVNWIFSQFHLYSLRKNSSLNSAAIKDPIVFLFLNTHRYFQVSFHETDR